MHIYIYTIVALWQIWISLKHCLYLAWYPINPFLRILSYPPHCFVHRYFVTMYALNTIRNNHISCYLYNKKNICHCYHRVLVPVGPSSGSLFICSYVYLFYICMIKCWYISICIHIYIYIYIHIYIYTYIYIYI
jgi:hypothetical protein